MEEASVSVRLNPFKGLAGPEGDSVPWSPYGRILKERPVFTLDPLFHAGCYYVQDSSAMYVGHLFRKLLSTSCAHSTVADCAVAETAAASGNRSHPRLRKREGPAAEGGGRGPAQPDVSGGWLPRSGAQPVSSLRKRYPTYIAELSWT